MHNFFLIPSMNDKCTGLHSTADIADAGAILALRALGWGTLYAVAGTSCLCYGIYKLSGAKNVSYWHGFLDTYSSDLF